jgi:hypothetical protein
MIRENSPLAALSNGTRGHGGGFVASIANFFKREIDQDLVVRGDAWLKESGLQRQLEFEGYQLRWAPMNRVALNIADGWQHALVPHYRWWKRRVRRRFGTQDQYLLKRVRSFRAMGA